MRLAALWLTDFRCYEHAELHVPPGVTVVYGANAQGKTSLLEAVAWVANGRSFRGVPDVALVRTGCDAAFVRAEIVDDERAQLVEAEIRVVGRNRVLVNRRPVTGVRARRDALAVTVFSPDDLQLVKSGPGRRRDYLDDLLATAAPRYRETQAEYERVLRQRNALLRGGMRGPDAAPTLAVFDAQLARAGARLVGGRLRLIDRVLPHVVRAYDELASGAAAIDADYEADWSPAPGSGTDLEGELLGALSAGHRVERERGTTLAGPHRDEWRLRVSGLDSRTHASQGEQRTLALALRLGGHRLLTEVTGSAPVLLLDDVFSELDERRGGALVEHLGGGQTLITTAGTLPPGVRADSRWRVDDGRIAEAA